MFVKSSTGVMFVRFVPNGMARVAENVRYTKLDYLIGHLIEDSCSRYDESVQLIAKAYLVGDDETKRALRRAFEDHWSGIAADLASRSEVVYYYQLP